MIFVSHVYIFILHIPLVYSSLLHQIDPAMHADADGPQILAASELKSSSQLQSDGGKSRDAMSVVSLGSGTGDGTRRSSAKVFLPPMEMDRQIATLRDPEVNALETARRYRIVKPSVRHVWSSTEGMGEGPESRLRYGNRGEMVRTRTSPSNSPLAPAPVPAEVAHEAEGSARVSSSSEHSVNAGRDSGTADILDIAVVADMRHQHLTTTG